MTRSSLDKHSDTLLLSCQSAEIAPEEIIGHSSTGMKSRLKLSDNSHREKVWSEDMVYHYVNTLLDKFAPDDSGIAVFKSSKSYGPKAGGYKVVIHPFQWGGDWHLALGFRDFGKKVVFVDCSDGKPARAEAGASAGTREGVQFNLHTVVDNEEFVEFAGCKVSQWAVKYPQRYPVLFEPVSEINAVNLLAVVFGFCSDSESLTRSFCDPDFEPRKYNVEEFYPVLRATDRYAYTRQILGNRFVNRMLAKSRQDENSVLDSELKGDDVAEPLQQLDDLFPESVATEFLDWLGDVDEFGKVPEFLDDVDRMLTRLSHDPRTHPTLTDAEKQPGYTGWTPLVRPNVYAEYTKKTKMEFDETTIRAALAEADHPSQVFPLLFENGTAYIVHIKHDPDSPVYAHAEVAVVTNRPSTNDRAVLKNYSLRRLVELYCWQYHRLVRSIDVTLNILKDHSPYNMVMALVYLLHRSLFQRRVDSKFKPDTATLDNYGMCMQGMLHGIVSHAGARRDINYKGMLKYLMDPKDS